MDSENPISVQTEDTDLLLDSQKARIGLLRPICHQRELRDQRAALEPRPLMQTMDGCYVRQVTREEAQALILKYEWLGTMPAKGICQYGLFTPDGEMIGVACFGYGSGSQSRYICTDEPERLTRDGEKPYRDLTICLERGACVHWAHPHAASFLIARAVRKVYEDHGFRIVYAYSDPLAGEVGTVYQACNWHYIGGRGSYRWYFLHRPTGKWYSTKALRARKHAKARSGRIDPITKGMPIQELRKHPDWYPQARPDKGRYVFFEGSKKERRDALRALRFSILPYPKRDPKLMGSRYLSPDQLAIMLRAEEGGGLSESDQTDELFQFK